MITVRTFPLPEESSPRAIAFIVPGQGQASPEQVGLPPGKFRYTISPGSFRDSPGPAVRDPFVTVFMGTSGSMVSIFLVSPVAIAPSKWLAPSLVSIASPSTPCLFMPDTYQTMVLSFLPVRACLFRAAWESLRVR